MSRLRSLAPLERDTQAAILRYLKADRRVAWAARFNTGAHEVKGVDAKGRPTRRFIRYAFPGCADVLGQLIGGGQFLAVEVKREGETAEPEQAAFLARVREAGGLAILARSVEDVKRELDAFFGESVTNLPPMREIGINPTRYQYPRGIR